MTTASESGNPSASDVATGRRPTDFVVLLPPGWVRLPVGGGADAVVARLVSARFQQLPPGQRDVIRRALRRQLLDTVASAGAASGIEVLLCVDPVRGKSVSASCLVSFVPPPAGAGAAPAPELLPALGTGESAAEWSVVPVAGQDALRRRHRGVTSPEPVTGNPVTGNPVTGNPVTGNPVEPVAEATVTRVDYVIPVPGSSAHLALSFATVTEPVVDALVALFDAIARSLRWVWSS